MRYEYQDGKCSFEIPDQPTVRQQMQYFGAIGSFDENYLLRWWHGARLLIQSWQCEAFPDKDADLDSVTNPAVTDMLIWASLRVREHMNSLEKLEKN